MLTSIHGHEGRCYGMPIIDPIFHDFIWGDHSTITKGFVIFEIGSQVCSKLLGIFHAKGKHCIFRNRVLEKQCDSMVEFSAGEK